MLFNDFGEINENQPSINTVVFLGFSRRRKAKGIAKERMIGLSYRKLGA